MRTPAIALWLTLLCAVGFGGVAHAEEPPPGPGASERATARNLMQIGDQKNEGGDYVGALEAYAAADAIMGVPTTGLALGKVQAKLGRLVEAADTLLRVTRYPRSQDEPMAFTRARQEASRLAPRIVERTPAVTIRLVGVPIGAEVTLRIDRALVPSSAIGLPHKLNPGTHQIVAGSPGWIGEQQVTLQEAEHRDLTIELERGEAPDDFYEHLDQAEAGDDQPGGISPVVWIGFGVGAAGLVVGTVSGILALSQSADLEDACPNMNCEPAAQEDLDRAYTAAHVSTVGFIVAGVGTSVGLIALFVGGSGDEPETAKRALEIEPLLGLGVAGVQGRF